jgi:hypothetical protein
MLGVKKILLYWWVEIPDFLKKSGICGICGNTTKDRFCDSYPCPKDGFHCKPGTFTISTIGGTITKRFFSSVRTIFIFCD